MKVILLGRKAGAAAALGYLLHRGVEVAAVVAQRQVTDEPNLYDAARACHLLIATPRELAALLREGDSRLADVDLVLSYLYRSRIRSPLLTLGRLGCVNFHPSPLPDYRGVAGYSFGILNQEPTWSVSAHFVDEDFDTGDLIAARTFPIVVARETARTLEAKAQDELFILFCQVIDQALTGEPLPRTPQGAGTYYSFHDLEQRRIIRVADSSDLVERKIRAFWFPPFPGAVIYLNEEPLTLVNDIVLHHAVAPPEKRLVMAFGNWYRSTTSSPNWPWIDPLTHQEAPTACAT